MEFEIRPSLKIIFLNNLLFKVPILAELDKVYSVCQVKLSTTNNF